MIMANIVFNNEPWFQTKPNKMHYILVRTKVSCKTEDFPGGNKPEQELFEV